MQESLFFIQRIRAMYDINSFSKSEVLIADYLLKNPDTITSATASSLAEDVGTSPATVVRFCRKLGFTGLSDMKMNAIYNYANSESNAMDLKHNDSAEEVKNKVINYTKSVLNQLGETLDNEALKQSAKYIKAAKRLTIVGEGGSGTIAKAAYDILMKLALNCQYVEDPFFQTMVIDTMEKGDVLLIFCNTGRSVNSLKNAQHAQEKGCKTIGVVGMGNTELSDFLDAEIRTMVFDSNLFSDNAIARTCELMTISIIYSMVALKCDENQLEKGRSVIESLERKRFSN